MTSDGLEKLGHATGVVTKSLGLNELLNVLHVTSDPVRNSRDMESKENDKLVTADWMVWALLLASMILTNAARATTATIEKIIKDTIISTKVKPRERKRELQVASFKLQVEKAFFL